MGISRKNNEGYLDLTAEAGVRLAERNSKWRKMVYICSPYAGNAIKAENAGNAVNVGMGNAANAGMGNVGEADGANGSNIIPAADSTKTINIEKNVQNAIRYCRFAISKGVVPVASHLLYPQILDDRNPADRKLGLKFGIKLLKACREIWVFADDDSGISEGMWAEIDAAHKSGKVIRYFTKDLRERI